MRKSELKKSIFLTLLAVAVTSISLVTATYAWFVNYSNVNVEETTFTAEAAQLLEVAVPGNATELADGNSTTLLYKQIVTNADVDTYLTKSTGQFGTLRQLRISSTSDTTKFFEMSLYNGNLGGGVKFFESALDYDRLDIPFEDGKPFLLIPMFFRSNTNSDVYLFDYNDGLNQRGTVITGTNNADGVGENIAKAARIAFVSYDSVGAIENTVIFEPNSGDSLIARDTTAYTGGISNNEAGIKSLNADGTILETASQNKQTSADLVITTTNKTLNAVDVPAGKNPVFSLDARTPKLVYLYVWLEGMDYDCLANITNGALNVSLAFIAAQK